jgi:hypothetical protein
MCGGKAALLSLALAGSKQTEEHSALASVVTRAILFQIVGKVVIFKALEKLH